EIGEISDVIEITQGGQSSYSILIRVEATAQNASGLAEQTAVANATQALTGFLSEAEVTISTRIGRWGEDVDGQVYGPGVYGVLPNDPPAVEARPSVPTTTQALLDQLVQP